MEIVDRFTVRIRRVGRPTNNRHSRRARRARESDRLARLGTHAPRAVGGASGAGDRRRAERVSHVSVRSGLRTVIWTPRRAHRVLSSPRGGWARARWLSLFFGGLV